MLCASGGCAGAPSPEPVEALPAEPVEALSAEPVEALSAEPVEALSAEPAAPAANGGAIAPRRARGLEATLGELADRALADGELELAESRYERMRARDPRSVRALVGLGRVALARQDVGAARERFAEALRADPGAIEARLGMVDVASVDAEESPERAREVLESVLAQAPRHPRAHASLEALTGRAPRLAGSLPEALLLAERHPYDPRALVEAARRLSEAGRAEEAAKPLEAVLLLADLDREATDAAIALLPSVSESWRDRRVVPVYVFLDARLRSDPGWRYRQRWRWLALSQALEPLLHTRFLVRGFVSFDAERLGPSLEAWLVTLARMAGASGRSGIFAGFSAVPTPRRNEAKRGLAEYLGRRLVVRDAPGEKVDLVLAHEVLHLYGGIHVSDELDSLMNPGGGGGTIDALNADIARSTAARRFEPGGIQRNVLSQVDLTELSDAYEQALRVNLAFRRLGMSELIGDAKAIGPGAAARAREITRTDSHMGDVASFLSQLFWTTGRRVEAVAVLEAAAGLYGRDTAAGRGARARADGLRRYLKQELGVE